MVGADPVAAGLLRSPGEWGADVVVGEGQAFGTPSASAARTSGCSPAAPPTCAACPGRLVGETVDVEGRTAYVTTLRAREQDIRREKATSNVCTNQTLMAVTAAVQLGWLGTSGLGEVATRCARGTRYAREAAAGRSTGSTAAGPTPRCCGSSPCGCPVPADVVIERMADEGFLAGDLPLERRRSPTAATTACWSP